MGLRRGNKAGDGRRLRRFIESRTLHARSGFQELKGYPAPAKVAPAADDLSLAKRLWSETERLTGVTFTL